MKKFLLIALVVLVFSISAIGQSTASLHGRVTDEHNAIIPGAEVRLRSRCCWLRTTVANIRSSMFRRATMFWK